jgi:hypothetical protein
VRAEPAVIAAAVALFLAGCGSPERRWPFPEMVARDDATILGTLANRTSGIRSLYAELAMSFDTGERSAVLTAVVNFIAPDRIRMSAFKDILIASRSVFDFIIGGGKFVAVLEGEEGPERREGALDDLERVHPGFRAMGAMREAMFLPGRIPPGAPARVERSQERITLHTQTPSGHPIAWELDPDTFGVTGAKVSFGGGGPPATIVYESYRPAGTAFIPERFRLDDPGAGVVLEGWLEDLEVNPELDPALFDPGSLEPRS